MRVRTTLAIGVLAVTAILGGAGSALADNHNEGDVKSCGQFAGAADGRAFWGERCTQIHWVGDASKHRHSFYG
ncbi:hypothetical protein [Streptomyces sp. NPDC005423]|uniref:hypothetical protein n=1 Tax=Streptomyces sp. NPDC005423 TaxID=3155343 RepID=UPI0033BF3BCC